MPNYSTKKQVSDALTSARKRLKKARDNKDVAATEKALKDCKDLQHVLDRWDALHS